jgi:electron transfer flavoprotein alpha subunit
VLCRKYNPSAVFVGGTTNGRDFAPRFAARLETGCTSDATEVIYNPETTDIEFVEPAAGGKIMAVITVPVLRPQVGTIRPGTFKYIPAGQKAGIEELHEKICFDPEKIRTKFLSFEADAFDPELDIANEDVIICVGNGLADEASLQRYRDLAKLLGGKIACTRPLYDREILSYKLQVGQSGVMVKPKLYIGFGISGAVNHVTGVEAEKFVAVNTDPDAPIFHYCDYGIVGDMDEVCDAMIAAIKAGKK